MEGQELRRSVTLSERFSAVDSSNLRDLLKVRDDDEARPSRRGSITLASVLASEKLESAVAASGGGGSGGGSGRTLLDIMRQEQEMNGSVAMDGNTGNDVNWNFNDGIPHLRTADAWFDAAAFVPSHPAPMSHLEFVIASPPNPTTLPRSISLSVSTRNTELPQQPPTSADGLAAASAHNPPPPSAANTRSQLSANVQEVAVGSNTAERSYLNDDALARAPAPSVEEQQQPRISLMALLEQTDGHWGGSPSPVVTVTAAAEVEDEGIDHIEEHNGIRTIYICCVCMVRQKGAAFIPCGHTFCRLCSRELWVSRGSCPLCNGYILEILDIF